MFNISHSGYLICFHTPQVIIDTYYFNVRLIAQTLTSLAMHGGNEAHTGYLYQRIEGEAPDGRVVCDPYFWRWM
jgi:hypothetical protein